MTSTSSIRTVLQASCISAALAAAFVPLRA